MRLASGTRLGRYVIVAPLGAGGMGEVYQATDTRLNRQVAIKMLPIEVADDPHFRVRLRREAEVIAALKHPHICVLYDVVELDGVDYLVMEYLEGETLAARLRQGPLPFDETLRYAIEMVGALDAAHRRGIIHRDLKPGNIMLTDTGAKLLDFGIAKRSAIVAGDAPHAPTTIITAAGSLLGTLGYLAPERLNGLDADARSDIFALGVILYEMTTGRQAFKGDTPAQLIAAILTGEPAAAAFDERSTPPLLKDLVLKCLAKDPEKRWQSAPDLLEALRRVNQEPAQAPGQLRSLTTRHKSNLPAQSTQLVGRGRELEEAGALIPSHRLLTLTGPGGSGKTRLALQLAADAIEQFPDGVFWVPLQSLRDPNLVERAIAASIGADGGLIEHVASKRLLVLLDNFEQVIEAAPTVSSLLARTPNAKVLVTSREPLHVEFEQRYTVEPLRDDDAAVLFTQRARAVAPGFRSTPVVGEICRRLDGLPLAIELAAAQVALLDPDELLARLGRHPLLLTSRSRDAPARQRTLRAAIEWSHELLGPREKQLFRQLGVFSGSFSLGAAEAICHADLEGLESLVVKSLVRRWGGGRLGMLDTIREYALERLEESPEGEDVRRRHAEFFLAVAQSANLNSGKLAAGGQRMDVVLSEQDNIRGALAWTLASGAVALGLEIATAMEQFWVTEDPREGMRWFAGLLGHPRAEAVGSDLRAHALRSYGGSAYLSGEHRTAGQVLEQSLALFQQLGDDHGCAVLLHRLGVTAQRDGDLDRARELVEASHAIHEKNEDWLSRTWGLAQTTGALGAIARDSGDEQRGYELIAHSARMAREAGVRWWERGALAELACLALNAGRIDEADTHARESLRLAKQLHDRAGRVFGVGLLARVAAERGQSERAGRLWGSIEDEDAGAPLGGWRRHRQECEARIREAAGDEFERGRAEGCALTLDDAVSLALE